MLCCSTSRRAPVDSRVSKRHAISYGNPLGTLLLLCQVFAAAMSNASGRQHLLAVGTDDPQARLCDIRSGASTHVLTGHSEAVWACTWSPRSDFLLATGSADQTVRIVVVATCVVDFLLLILWLNFVFWWWVWFGLVFGCARCFCVCLVLG